MRNSPAVELIDVTKSYPGVRALAGVSASFPAGTFTAVMGPSGSGKSTFLHCAAGLDRPDAGRVLLGGRDIAALREPRLTEARRRVAGFVFQSYNLLDSLSVWHNVLLPQRLAGVRPDRSWAREVLHRVGLSGREDARPAQLSGGQRQRVALARALAGRPEVIFADEPTGALDLTAGHEVLGLLREAVDDLGATIVMVTHDPAAAAHADRVVFLADGHIVAELAHPTADSVAARMTAVSTHRGPAPSASGATRHGSVPLAAAGGRRGPGSSGSGATRHGSVPLAEAGGRRGPGSSAATRHGSVPLAEAGDRHGPGAPASGGVRGGMTGAAEVDA
ncbi:hypothetical protein GCM10010168_75650 [Actinoplanes ianthinogenes]|uniref:ABC transporter domain-containing protein n=1 Tax=Actinoplanes ianthinogenes TaxID=122358 RepID=A0ABN6CC35_9ACTN|nr:hypothetical protein Aiant_25340 [Actinoplanes ianthinogenes]GGR45684.1 hypothetical protein GCM10010168_75650 [Actinoplanes ianthinogenes]